MEVITGKYTKQEHSVVVETFAVKMEDGTEFQITAESNAATPETGRLEITKMHLGMIAITITPVVGNKVILA